MRRPGPATIKTAPTTIETRIGNFARLYLQQIYSEPSLKSCTTKLPPTRPGACRGTTIGNRKTAILTSSNPHSVRSVPPWRHFRAAGAAHCRTQRRSSLWGGDPRPLQPGVNPDSRRVPEISPLTEFSERFRALAPTPRRADPSPQSRVDPRC